MKLGNRIWNWRHGVQKGPQNLGYIVQDDGELLLVSYDRSKPAYVFGGDDGGDPDLEERMRRFEQIMGSPPESR